MSYRVEVRRQRHGGEWTWPILFNDFVNADAAACRIWQGRGMFLYGHGDDYGPIEGVRIIDVARELQPDLDPVVLLMEQRRIP